jgi:hypothetical protein
MKRELMQLQADVALLRRQIAGMQARQRTLRGTGRTIRQVGHGFAVGEVLRISGVNTYTKAQADTAANAQAVGVVGVVVSADTFMLYGPGTVIPGLSSITAGTRYYLSAATAGAVTSTAPTIAVPIYDGLTTTAGVVAIGGGSGGSSLPTPASAGQVLAAKSDLSGPEWVIDLDLGANATSQAGVLRIRSPNASGDAVVIDGALVTAAAKKLTVREIDVCDAGTAKKMLILGSATY